MEEFVDVAEGRKAGVHLKLQAFSSHCAASNRLLRAF
jgi:hypothetical protein